VWREILDMFSYTLDGAENGGVALEVRLDWVILKMGQNTDAL